MDTMKPKERIKAALAHKPVDRTPFAVLNGQGWIAARNGLDMAKLLDLPDAGAGLLVDAYREIGSDIMTSGCGAAWPMMEVMGGKVDMNALSAEIISRPISSLSETGNIDVNKVISDMRKNHYYRRTLVQMKNMRDIVKDEYVIGGGFFGPFTMAAQMLGVQDFMIELLDGEEEEIRAIIDFCAEIVIAYLDDLIDSGLDLITIPEPVASGDLISPSLYGEYALPADLKVKERLKDRCPDVLIHICGKTDKLVSAVAEAGFGVFSVDSIDMVKAQNDAAGRCALFGNLSPSLILAEKDPEQVYRISKELCEKMKSFGGFILAPGCDLAPNIPLENLQAMVNAAKDT